MGDEIWIGQAERSRDVGRWGARGGPEWPIGVETTVVLQVRGRRDIARIRIDGVKVQAAV